ncbi:MAG: MotA/TolQ/ExbB proton channel family protein [Gammaproteobacteria bacterium]|jgi:biopolymer transport protein ExbB|nr:biopolymer transporter ExbB [Gammaproteobacteria bacterium]MDP6146701.1 MotA/TolQ/ExbB proton channel family protein [Gammaproteobacteria bacterium]HJL80103.1 MotA/TolQ/ExbB proton channel family protein [Gammaproteobacteria bacterium]HJM08584.1 MotA/TolQ/ExbB proton channel family protein [Gammaproteobacteria bacterium]|tara:strand:+ start:22834 stop:23454 length:621 start_codon:yes stop_codon:yes gene_type:complete
MSILNKLSSIIGKETDLNQSVLILSVLTGLVLTIFFLIIGQLREFFEAGGPVLWGILLVTMIMWTLIIERFWYFNKLMPTLSDQALNQWKNISNKGDWFSMRIRDQIISEVSAETRKFILTIETMMQILPLLGLLGTVVGMINVFDVMTFFGTGNARLMASGVSQATIPTMAGLVAAISGVYIANLLKRKAEDEINKVADQLIIHE